MTGLITRLVLGVTSIGLVSELISRGKARLQVVATCHEHPSRNSHFETRMNMLGLATGLASCRQHA